MRSYKKLYATMLGGAICSMACSGIVSPAFADDGKPEMSQRQLEEEARARYDVDNTGRNVRDSGQGSVSPMDQSASVELTELTSDIRAAIRSEEHTSELQSRLYL